MAHSLSKEDRERLETALASAEPYDEDAPLKENDHAMDAVRYFVRTMRLVKRADEKPYTPL